MAGLEQQAAQMIRQQGQAVSVVRAGTTVPTSAFCRTTDPIHGGLEIRFAPLLFLGTALPGGPDEGDQIVIGADRWLLTGVDVRHHGAVAALTVCPALKLNQTVTILQHTLEDTGYGSKRSTDSIVATVSAHVRALSDARSDEERMRFVTVSSVHYRVVMPWRNDVTAKCWLKVGDLEMNILTARDPTLRGKQMEIDAQQSETP